MLPLLDFQLLGKWFRLWNKATELFSRLVCTLAIKYQKIHRFLGKNRNHAVTLKIIYFGFDFLVNEYQKICKNVKNRSFFIIIFLVALCFHFTNSKNTFLIPLNVNYFLCQIIFLLFLRMSTSCTPTNHPRYNSTKNNLGGSLQMILFAWLTFPIYPSSLS